MCLLSINLEHPTPANLRNECLVLFKHGLEKRDESMLKSFFELPLEKELKPGTIRKFEIGKFKPLNNFLRGYTYTTSNKNIELLAWLIDFPHRPYFKYTYAIEKEKKGLSSLMVSKTGVFSGIVSQAPVFSDHYPGTDISAPSNYLIEQKDISNEKVIFEYPNGVKVTVDSSNLNLISQLIKLW
ncbi:hypothetical protein [Elizabethkingia anophelis]|uniref:hypothetical protein n=1 Tax=Elizabethkingia anophelis TaxID=1117645 RepID=UPI00136D0782|nr:hypothetical protein [Elizabethkingia anophelis]MYY43995.1 hypothetical protein [Elizabethkingia anophelis]